MLERHDYPPGVPCWVDTAQPDPDAAADFYTGLFGWDFEDRAPVSSPGRYLVARLRGRDVAAIGARVVDPPSAPAWMTYVRVESADRAAAVARQAGGTVVTGPVDVAHDGRVAVVRDPAGAVLSLWEARGHHGAGLVNEPGTWNWSDLHTRDPLTAKRFYGALFGWRAVAFGPDTGDFAMWTLPGYGDHLTGLDPDIRRRHAEGGAPEGFTDAVGWLIGASNEESAGDAAAGWTVTFAVGDADTAVARAEDLGASVLTPPFDEPPVRAAVLADPQGAVFTVSAYRPRS